MNMTGIALGALVGSRIKEIREVHGSPDRFEIICTDTNIQNKTLKIVFSTDEGYAPSYEIIESK